LSPHLFFSSAATPATYPLSLHDALPIFPREWTVSDAVFHSWSWGDAQASRRASTSSGENSPSITRKPSSQNRCTSASLNPFSATDRKSTRLNSSHVKISYAVFCLKKKR